LRASILIEGSSSATGLYDESGKGGFAGRVQHHYEKYNIQERTQKLPDLRWVFVYQNAQPDMRAYGISLNLQAHLDEVRNRTRTKRILGIFLMGGYPDHEVMNYGEKIARKRELEGLEKIADKCWNAIEPIFLRPPNLSRSLILSNGKHPNLKLREEFEGYVRGTAFQLGAPYITFEQALGAPFEDYAAPDQKHTTAKGYDRVARFLTRIIDHKLGIAPDESVEKELARYAVPTSDLVYPKSDFELLH